MRGALRNGGGLLLLAKLPDLLRDFQSGGVEEEKGENPSRISSLEFLFGISIDEQSNKSVNTPLIKSKLNRACAVNKSSNFKDWERICKHTKEIERGERERSFKLLGRFCFSPRPR